MQIPLPPVEMRRLVGPTEVEAFDNPTGRPVFGAPVEEHHYRTVFDFGCGCGRIARQLAQQDLLPEEYLGCDLHPRMINWCIENIHSRFPNFRFYHHDVYEKAFNPNGSMEPKLLDAPTSRFSLVNAHSVFTHIPQSQVEHYLKEAVRVLQPVQGIFRSTWFFFDKSDFPMMKDFQNALYINERNVTNAVIYDFEWISKLFEEMGLRVIQRVEPRVRGFQWIVFARKQKV